MGKEVIIRTSDLVKSYSIKRDKVTSVLKGITLDIYKGEFAALMGPSGVGKSTLLHLLGSLDKPDKGTIDLYLNGKTYNYNKLSSQEIANLRNKSIGFIFQFHHLLPEFTALENVMMPALIMGKSYNDTKKKAVNLLDTVGVGERADHKPMELSGGEQQRVSIARALINEPALVLADEPTGNLDLTNAASVLSLIKELRERFSITFVVATHSPDVAGIAERILNMADGRIAGENN